MSSRSRIAILVLLFALPFVAMIAYSLLSGPRIGGPRVSAGGPTYPVEESVEDDREPVDLSSIEVSVSTDPAEIARVQRAYAARLDSLLSPSSFAQVESGLPYFTEELRWHERGAVGKISRMLASEPDPQRAATLRILLAYLDTASADRYLMPLLEGDDDALVAYTCERLSAALTLRAGTLGPAARARALELLQTSSLALRESAIRLVGAAHLPEGESALRQLLRHPSLETRSAAADELVSYYRPSSFAHLVIDIDRTFREGRSRSGSLRLPARSDVRIRQLCLSTDTAVAIEAQRHYLPYLRDSLELEGNADYLLHGLRIREAIDLLTDEVDRDEGDELVWRRLYALEGLARVAPERARERTDLMLGALRSTTSIELLGRLYRGTGDESVCSALFDAVEEESKLRAAAHLALLRIGTNDRERMSLLESHLQPAMRARDSALAAFDGRTASALELILRHRLVPEALLDSISTSLPPEAASLDEAVFESLRLAGCASDITYVDEQRPDMLVQQLADQTKGALRIDAAISESGDDGTGRSLLKVVCNGRLYSVHCSSDDDLIAPEIAALVDRALVDAGSPNRLHYLQGGQASWVVYASAALADAVGELGAMRYF